MVSVPLVEVVRSGFRESVHHGSVALLDAAGRDAGSLGEVLAPVSPRSANKPLQALAMLRSGFAPLSDADLALSCASHSGEPDHVARVRGLLATYGLTEAALRCPPDLPLFPAARDRVLAAGGGPAAVTMNCSGKHAAMLATCVHNGWPTEDYLSVDHPLTAAVSETIAELTGERPGPPGVDGCGAPLFTLSLTGLARAYSRLVTAPPGSQEARIAHAMRAHPRLVAGTGREDTLLMSAVPGLLCKIGAEGAWALALPDGRAAALKIDDGASRARQPVGVGALRALGAPWTRELAELAEVPVEGGGRQVGSVRLLPGVLS
ncbi:asparaginase [Actinoalloteichus spitiensis]|uniref:asparaginase n=1 Tax=Actinoalloteichus spitiensis TaxID=252394 RepID=UPI001B7FA74B|nr:asparaginase [Actinoalloteichus spitiensis]